MSTPWSSSERVQIRKYLGYPSLFHQFDTSVEAAITAVQAQSDGGALPDDSTQQSIRVILSELQDIQDRITQLYCSLKIVEAGTDNVKINSARALIVLKNEGRRRVTELCIPLGLIGPRQDIFSPLPTNNAWYPFNSGF